MVDLYINMIETPRKSVRVLTVNIPSSISSMKARINSRKYSPVVRYSVGYPIEVPTILNFSKKIYS